MKKLGAALLSVALVGACPALAEGEAKTATATAQGFGGEVSVTVTVETAR